MCSGLVESRTTPLTGRGDDAKGEEVCTCRTYRIGWCSGSCLACDPDDETAQLTETDVNETLAAIKAGESIPADGPFFYVRRGAEFVLRRKCDAAEMVRVAAAEVESTPILGLD